MQQEIIIYITLFIFGGLATAARPQVRLLRKKRKGKKSTVDLIEKLNNDLII